MNEQKVYVVVYERIDVNCPFDTEFRIEGVFADEKQAEACMHKDFAGIKAELDGNEEKILNTEKYADNCEIRVGCENCGDDVSVIFRWRVVMNTLENTH